jgi:hypothetical protein
VLLTAIIYGNSIRSAVGMSNIRRIIGVCPQVTSTCVCSQMLIATCFQLYITLFSISMTQKSCVLILNFASFNSLISFGMHCLVKSTFTSLLVSKAYPLLLLNWYVICKQNGVSPTFSLPVSEDSKHTL